MPKKQDLKCYFGCIIDGPLHLFPKPLWPHMERFNAWKSVLRQDTQAKGDNFLFNQVRLCHRHFQSCYCLPSKLLTWNAIPTLNIGSTLHSQQIEEPVIMPEIIEIPLTIETSRKFPPVVMVSEPKLQSSNTARTCIGRHFCQIRSNGIRNVNPSTNQFANAYKTLLINNFSSPHSVNANCEEDQNKSLKTVKLLFNKKDSSQQNLQDALEVDMDLVTFTQECRTDNNLHTEAKSYVTGYVAKKCRLKYSKNAVHVYILCLPKMEVLKMIM